MFATFFFHIRHQAVFDRLQFFLGHEADLSHTECQVIHNKFLIILIKDFFRCLTAQIASGTEHFIGKAFDLDLGDLCQFLCCLFITFRTGR